TGPLNGESLWTEPDSTPNTPKANVVSLDGLLVFVTSDISEAGTHDNGVTDTTSFLIGNSPLNVTFTDNGDSSVPDAAATLSLLSLSLAGLGIFRRKLNS